MLFRVNASGLRVETCIQVSCILVAGLLNNRRFSEALVDSETMQFDPFLRVNDVYPTLIDHMETVAFLVNGVLE